MASEQHSLKDKSHNKMKMPFHAATSSREKNEILMNQL